MATDTECEIKGLKTREKLDILAQPDLDIIDLINLNDCSAQHFYDLWSRGEGPPWFKVGKTRKILTRHYLEWIEAQAEEAKRALELTRPPEARPPAPAEPTPRKRVAA